MSADEDIRTRLFAGERLLWSGQPRQGLMLTPMDALLIPFSLFWGGVAIFWESSVLTTSAPVFFAVWGLPFVLVGFFLIGGRFFADAWLRGRIQYGLSDQRVLILRSGPFSSLTSLNLNRMGEITLKEGKAGRGTIRLGQSALFWGRRGFGGWLPALDPTPQLLGVEDVRRVFDQIERARRSPTN